MRGDNRLNDPIIQTATGDIVLEGYASLQRRFQIFPKELPSSAVRPALQKAGTVVLREARQAAPYLRGVLKSALNVRKTLRYYQNAGEIVVHIVGADYGLAPHQHLSEFGTVERTSGPPRRAMKNVGAGGWYTIPIIVSGKRGGAGVARRINKLNRLGKQHGFQPSKVYTSTNRRTLGAKIVFRKVRAPIKHGKVAPMRWFRDAAVRVSSIVQSTLNMELAKGIEKLVAAAK